MRVKMPCSSRKLPAAWTLRDWLANPDRAGSFADRARTQRRGRLLAAHPGLERMTVLDLGGTAGFWQHLRIRPADLTLVNLHDCGAPGVRMIIGDATRPPRITFDRSYDLVLSNSVIDQVGGLEDRRRLAEVIRGAGRFYWVQTANRRFPVDAYFLFPYFSALPVPVRAEVLRHWRLTGQHTRDRDEARERVGRIELQSRRDMRALFPGAEAIVERFAGLPKSLIATNHI